MKVGPDIARLAALIGDPARANMLLALMSGQALTASELAQEAGVMPQTASSHLTKLQAANLLSVEKHGRHRYFRIANAAVAAAIEGLMVLSEAVGPKRTRPGPKEQALRKARACYDHLAGQMGVKLYERLAVRECFILSADSITLSQKGKIFVRGLGIDLTSLYQLRRPLCRQCLDWSVRRSHLAGALGASFLTLFLEKQWARRQSSTRVILFSTTGEQKFYQMLEQI